MHKHSIYVAVASIFIVARAAAAEEVQFQVIVHPTVTVTDMKATELAKIFLGQVSRWPDGTRAYPVDLSVANPGRRMFSSSVLKAEVNSVKRYWYQQVFSGRGTPPPEKGSTADVVAFVANTPGAVGYVARDTNIPGCKALPVTFD